MTRVKICGLTNADDVRAACDAGADGVGFIFVSLSQRYIGGDPEAARRLIAGVPPFVTRVGVFDGLPDVHGAANLLHAVQYYGAAGPSSLFSPGARPAPIAIKTFRIRDERSLDEIAADSSPKDAILLDAYSAGALGGTGHTFNWDLAVEAKRRFGMPVILAGGLTPENVGEAIAAVQPAMVDVSSGVESAPGIKDHDKVRRFIQAVRHAAGG